MTSIKITPILSTLLYLCLSSVVGNAAPKEDGYYFRIDERELVDMKLSIVATFSTSTEARKKLCTGLVLSANTIIVSGECAPVFASKYSGGGSVWIYDSKGTKIENADLFSASEGVNLIEKTAATGPARASADVLLLVFSKNIANGLGFTEVDSLSKLSARGASSKENLNSVTLYAYGKSKDGSLSLAHTVRTEVVREHDANGFFLVKVPDPIEPANSGSERTKSLSLVSWEASGALVFDERMELVGIVSYVDSNVIVQGQRELGKYAYVTDLRNSSVLAMYEKAIECSSGRTCAINFPNSGVEKARQVEGSIFASRENNRCTMKMTPSYDRDGKLQSVALEGIGEGCETYKNTFHDCYNNECRSDITCERIQIADGQYTLITPSLNFEGKSEVVSYSFGKDSYIKRDRSLDDLAVFILPESKCFSQAPKDAAQHICRPNGTKWVRFEAPTTFQRARELCAQNGMRMLNLDLANKFALEENANFDYWISHKASAEDKAQNRSIYPLLPYVQARDQLASLNFYTDDNVEKPKALNAVCICEP